MREILPPVAVDDPPVAASIRKPAAARGDKDITRVEALTASEPPGAAAPSLTCHVLGPFPDVSEMRRVEDRLHELGYHPRERTGDTRVDAGYWTYLPAMEREDALRVTRMLKEKNDRDFLIMKGNAISLGAFDSRSKVDRRVKMLKKYGLEPVVEPLYKSRTGRWLDIDLRDNELTVLETIQAEYPHAQPQHSACGSIAASGAID